MGWFWADNSPKSTASGAIKQTQYLLEVSPPPSSPVPNAPAKSNSASGCPYNSSESAKTPSLSQRPCPRSTIDAMNPLNYMPVNISQSRESQCQRRPLPTSRETSTIPRAADGKEDCSKWVYPSPQQMYNAMLRKGHKDTPEDAVQSMVAIHNFLNEGAWAEITEWERRFGRGLRHGWRECAYGEDGSVSGAMIAPDPLQPMRPEAPRLVRFMGRADAMTPKAMLFKGLGWLAPEWYRGPPPFDRHDWYVERRSGSGSSEEVRYVIDYYAAPPEPTGEPVFYLDIRPAIDGPTAAAERLIRWVRDIWWRGSGGRARLEGPGHSS